MRSTDSIQQPIYFLYFTEAGMRTNYFQKSSDIRIFIVCSIKECKLTKDDVFLKLCSPSVSLSDTEEAWMMQTSIAYEYDFTCEHATCMECWDTHEENHDQSKKVAEEATVQGEVNKDGNRRLNAKKESREEKIKGLKALLRKQEKAVKKLTGVHTTTQTQSSLSRSVECKVKNSRANHSAVTKGCSRQRLGARGRKSRRKLESCNSVASTRDVDIWMSRGDLITKDEFLAVVGLVRVAKFH